MSILDLLLRTIDISIFSHIWIITLIGLRKFGRGTKRCFMFLKMWKLYHILIWHHYLIIFPKSCRCCICLFRHVCPLSIWPSWIRSSFWFAFERLFRQTFVTQPFHFCLRFYFSTDIYVNQWKTESQLCASLFHAL